MPDLSGLQPEPVDRTGHLGKYYMSFKTLFAGPRVGDFHGRDNNFNLIRFSAATMVIWTHAFGLLRHTEFEPVHRIFGIGAGDLGVDIFFILSGFLVSKSLNGKIIIQFAWARFLRIYPGLWAATLISVLVVAAFFTNMSAGRFLINPSTLAYVLHNATLLPGLGARLALPHTFHYRNDLFNVALWTLPYELQMYGLLALLSVSLGLRVRYLGLIAASGALSVLMAKIDGLHLLEVDSGRFLYLFFVGSLMYALRARIALRGWIAATGAGLIVLTIALTENQNARQVVLLAVLPYLLLWCGLIPGGWLRYWNRLGDYSYGMYIYACPVQIALIATGVTSTPARNFIFSMLITAPFSVGSWHLLEKRVLHKQLPGFLAFPLLRRARARSLSE